MLAIKTLFIKSTISALAIITFVAVADLAYANIGTQTPLQVLHNGAELNSSHLNQELQPLESYKFSQPITTTTQPRQKNNIKLKELISQLAQITQNSHPDYEIMTHSLGDIILFEYLKSITMEDNAKKLLPTQKALLSHQAKAPDPRLK